MATVTDSATGITTTYYYDFLDRMMKYVESGTGYSHSVGYGYDTINNLTSLVETINGTQYTTSYAYDDDNRITSVTNGTASKTYTYDTYGRTGTQTTKNGETTVKTDSFTFTAPTDSATSGQIASHTVTAGSNTTTYTYTYDDNGNILTISDGTNTTSYVYDSANQLVRENNQAGNFTHTWTYDSAGNILERKEYAYTTGELGTPTDTVSYTYGNTNWGDLLTAYDGTAFTYETTDSGNTIGNLLSDGTWTYTWQHGRQLASMCNNNGTGDDTSDDVTWLYTYNADGMRTRRTNGAFVYEYVYNGSQLSRMTVSHRTSRTLNTLYFAYDASGTPMSVVYNGTTYYYITNIQGDVIAITDGAGTQVVSYTYDAWGNILSTDGTMKDTLGTHNPLRYRGYVYDTETGLYYLQSRYYNPEIGRFINADAFAATGQGFIGNNMFAYCLNNPVKNYDSAGARCVQVKPLSGGAKKKEKKRKPDKVQETAEKITILMFETASAVADGIEAEIAVGMGFGGTVSATLFGIPVNADLFVTTKLALVIDDGMIDVMSISSFGAGLPLSDYLGAETVKGVSHSLFDPECTCHINSSWRDMAVCKANKPFFDSSPSFGISAGGYCVIGGEAAIGYDFKAFADSAMRIYEDLF